LSKEAESPIAERPQEEVFAWRRQLLERAYPYLFLDATYLKVHCGQGVREVALLVQWGWTRRATRRCWWWRWQEESREKPTGNF
jgi:transposase-like protein